MGSVRTFELKKTCKLLGPSDISAYFNVLFLHNLVPTSFVRNFEHHDVKKILCESGGVVTSLCITKNLRRASDMTTIYKCLRNYFFVVKVGLEDEFISNIDKFRSYYIFY